MSIGKTCWIMRCTGVALLVLGSYMSAFAETVNRDISLTADGFTSAFRVFTETPVTLKNDHESILHDTEVHFNETGSRLVQIKKFLPSQSIQLEFVNKGSYSVCYSLAVGQSEEKRKCLSFNVVVLPTA